MMMKRRAVVVVDATRIETRRRTGSAIRRKRVAAVNVKVTVNHPKTDEEEDW